MAKKKTRKPVRYSQQRFWLNEYDPSELQLIDWLSNLKASRQYQPTMRNALRLYKALLVGDLEVLFELFPKLDAKLREKYRAELVVMAAAPAVTSQGYIPPTPTPPPPVFDEPIQVVIDDSTPQKRIGGFGRSIAKVKAVQ